MHEVDALQRAWNTIYLAVTNVNCVAEAAVDFEPVEASMDVVLAFARMAELLCADNEADEWQPGRCLEYLLRNNVLGVLVGHVCAGERVVGLAALVAALFASLASHLPPAFFLSPAVHQPLAVFLQRLDAILARLPSRRQFRRYGCPEKQTEMYAALLHGLAAQLVRYPPLFGVVDPVAVLCRIVATDFWGLLRCAKACILSLVEVDAVCASLVESNLAAEIVAHLFAAHAQAPEQLHGWLRFADACVTRAAMDDFRTGFATVFKTRFVERVVAAEDAALQTLLETLECVTSAEITLPLLTAVVREQNLAKEEGIVRVERGQLMRLVRCVLQQPETLMPVFGRGRECRALEGCWTASIEVHQSVCQRMDSLMALLPASVCDPTQLDRLYRLHLRFADQVIRQVRAAGFYGLFTGSVLSLFVQRLLQGTAFWGDSVERAYLLCKMMTAMVGVADPLFLATVVAEHSSLSVFRALAHILSAQPPLHVGELGELQMGYQPAKGEPDPDPFDALDWIVPRSDGRSAVAVKMLMLKHTVMRVLASVQVQASRPYTVVVY